MSPTQVVVNELAFSNSWHASHQAAATPANLKAVSAPSGIIVAWDAVYGALGYDLRVRLAGFPDWQSCDIPCNRYDTRCCVKGQTWECQIRTSGGDGTEFPWSDAVSAVTDPVTALGPSNIVTHATPSGLTIAWDPPQGVVAGDIDRSGVIALDTAVPGAFPCITGVGQTDRDQGARPWAPLQCCR